MDKHEHYMWRALALARRAANEASPNPMVGAILVKEQQIVGWGWHVAAGFEHAEVMAIENAGPDAEGATLYVTLEPCNHQGKTPPCVDAIIAAKIKRVVCAMSDPNPNVDGGGLDKLKSAGIEVIDGVLEDEAKSLNKAWVYSLSAKRPYVTLKLAMSADGKIAKALGKRTTISCAVSRAHVQKLRSLVGAIVVGSNTVQVDNPLLTNRSFYGKQPLRVVLDSKLQTSPSAKIYNSDATSVVVCSKDCPEVSREKFKDKGIVLFESDTHLSLEPTLEYLYKSGVNHILVEGGSHVAQSFLNQGLVNELLVYRSPKEIGEKGVGVFTTNDFEELAEKFGFAKVNSQPIGKDQFYQLER